MLFLGAMGVLYFMRNQGAGTDKPGTLASLLGADLSSSGVSAFGGTASAEVLDSGDANVAAPFNLQGWLENLKLGRSTASGGRVVTGGTGIALDPTTEIPPNSENLTPPEDQLAGTLSAFFEQQGLTVSEQSGMAIRQVGLMGRYDPLDVMTSNYPQIGFVDIESSSFIGGDQRREIGDQTVEVLRQAPGDYFVETTVGDDGSTVVTSDINKGASYFSTPNTIVAAVDQGYFKPPPVYVPRNVAAIQDNPLWQAGLDERAAEIEAGYKYVRGLSGAGDGGGTVYDLSIPASAAGGDWWGEG
jgi:hypothetical protein